MEQCMWAQLGPACGSPEGRDLVLTVDTNVGQKSVTGIDGRAPPR